MYEQQLAGRHILVTGAAGGIGRILCKVFLERGASVCGLDISEQGLAELVAEIGNAASLSAIKADLTEPSELTAALVEHQEQNTPFNCLVNNAAFFLDKGSLANTTAATWNSEIEGNLNGCFNVTKALLPELSEKGGAIVTIGSVNALTSLGHPAYSAAKAGMVSFARTIAMEYGSKNVRSNVILPGTVSTPAWELRASKDPEIFDKLAKWYPLGRIVKPEEVAYAAAFLLSDDASGISGAVLNVDCGLMAGVLPFAEQLTLEDLT